MTVTTYSEWIAAGRPWQNAPCVAAFAATARSHGYTVYTIGDEAHLQADPPQDHTPYSHTPWPGVQPYPDVMACDIMPGGDHDWITLGEQIVADKNARKPGTEWVKYVNYTDRDGSVWHYSWEPDPIRVPSGDTGHIHISARTDYAALPTWYWPTYTITPPPPTSGDQIMTKLPTLSRGSTGPAVSNLQALLNLHGAGLSVDGDFGPLTDAGVHAYQVAHGLAVDGIVGLHTWSILLLGHDL